MNRIAILTGMTATGKSEAALAFAERHPDIELINADSIQIFRRMDIGSAKPTAEELKRVPHHLIDIRDPNEPFSAGAFRREVDRCLAELEKRGKRGMIVGGTGFYLKALLYGMWEAEEADPAEREKFRASLEGVASEELQSRIAARDPESARKIELNDRYRLVRALEILQFAGRTPTELAQTLPKEPDARFVLLVIDRPKDELATRIDRRTRAMLKAGLLEEARGLLRDFPGARPLQSVGYAQAVAHLERRPPSGRKRAFSEDDLVEEINLATRQLCKRQRTWFRSQAHAQTFVLDNDRAKLDRALAEIYAS